MDDLAVPHFRKLPDHEDIKEVIRQLWDIVNILLIWYIVVYVSIFNYIVQNHCWLDICSGIILILLLIFVGTIIIHDVLRFLIKDYIVPDIHLEGILEKNNTVYTGGFSHLERNPNPTLRTTKLIPNWDWITPCPAEASHLERPKCISIYNAFKTCINSFFDCSSKLIERRW